MCLKLAYDDGWLEIKTKFDAIDIEKAESWDPADKDRILQACRDYDGGIAGVNKQVQDRMYEWVLHTTNKILAGGVLFRA